MSSICPENDPDKEACTPAGGYWTRAGSVGLNSFTNDAAVPVGKDAVAADLDQVVSAFVGRCVAKGRLPSEGVRIARETIRNENQVRNNPGSVVYQRTSDITRRLVAQLDAQLSAKSVDEKLKAEIKIKFTSELQIKFKDAFNSNSSISYYRGFVDTVALKGVKCIEEDDEVVLGVSAIVYRDVKLKGNFNLDEAIKTALDASFAASGTVSPEVAGAVKGSIVSEATILLTSMGSIEASADSVIVPYLVKTIPANKVPK